ncbi:hypothetical protein JCM10207_000146 [Rhodosporidiobolus poonsookiae]
MADSLARILVYSETSSPFGPVVIDAVLPVDEGFKVDLEQSDSLPGTDGTHFVVTLSSPSSAASTPSFAFLAPVPLPSHIASFLADVKKLQSAGGQQEDGKRWDWLRAYLPTGGGEKGSRRFGPGWEGSLGAAYSARRVSSSSRPSLSALDWSASGASMPGGFSSSRAGLSTSPMAERSEADLYSRDTHAAMERWLVQRMREREDEFLHKDEISVWCGTFNVNDKQPKNGAADIQSWVDSSSDADVLVFGFQELDLTAEALLRYTPYREEVWRKAIEEALDKREGGEKYEKLHSRQLVGVLLLVYVRTAVREHISEVSSTSLATGLMGLVANKGGVAIRLRYKDTPLTFVNSHLAAFTQNVAQRNAQVRDTAATLLFPFSSSAPDPSLASPVDAASERDLWTPNLRPEAVRPIGDGYSVWDCETLVWLGDLNYRIDLPRKDVERMVEAKEWELLQRFDQLRIQRQHHLAFADFEEAPIAFPPTFKFDVGTQVYDTSEKQRVPSWTDRVLWLSIHENTVRCEKYSSHPEIVISDHKPVSALLKLPVYTVIPDKRTEVQQQVIAELDAFDNEAQPDVKLSPGPSVEFSTIRYDEPVTQQVEVVNVGEVLAPWAFSLKPDSKSLTPPWLHISPTSGVTLPNARSTIMLTIHVAARSAYPLNFPNPLSSSTTLDIGLSDLLILSIEKKDLFLSVTAREWTPTVFGSSLEQLVRLHAPIRSLSLYERASIAVAANGEAQAEEAEPVGKVSVPQVLHRLVDFLAEHAIEVRDLFAVPGESELVKAVRECLDTGIDFPVDRFLPSSSAEPTSTPSPEDEHLHDAVSALEHLESDIGSISLSSPPLAPPEPPRPRSLSAASTSTRPPIDEEEDGRFAGLHAVATCVLRLLESLAEPVITYELYGRAIRAERREDAYAVVQALPETHANTLLYIIAFLRVLLGQTSSEIEKAAKMDRLAVVFSAVLLRPSPSSPPDKLDPATIPRRKKAFVLMLLQDQDAEAGREEAVGKA